MRLSIVVAFVGCVFLFSSCGLTKSVTKVSQPVETTLTEEQAFEFQYNFFEANKYFLAGNIDMSLSIFNQCLKIDPSSQAVHYKMASIYLAKKDLATASMHADKIYTSNDNVWYIYVAGTIYGQSNQKDKAISTFSRLIEMEPNQMDFYLSLADVYLQNNELNEAIKVYNRVDKVFGKSELISIQKNKIYMSLNKKNDAVNELIELYNYYGKDPIYKRLLAEFYIQIKDTDNAIIIYDQILQENNTDGYALIGLAECYRLKGEFEKSFTYIKQAFSAKDLPSDLKVSLLFNMLQSAQQNAELQREIYNLVSILYTQHPDNVDIKALYVNLLIDRKQFEEARDLLRDVTLVRKDKFALWEQLILLENQLSDWDYMFRETTEALTLFPTQSFLHFFQGFSAFQLEKYDSSLNAFEFGYRLTTKDDPLRLDFISFLGEVNHKIGNKSKSYSYFDDYLAQEPDNLGIMNNYAYYLSLDKENLDKAALMSKKTVDKDGKNSTYLDTYAWVLFEQKNYKEALIYIEKAVINNMDSSAVIVEHYGDILYYNDKISEAILEWKKSFDMDDSNQLLKRKIDAKMFLEE